MTNFLVTVNLATPRQILRGKADVANLWPNEMVIDKNQPGPVLPTKWAKPNKPAHLMFFSCLFLVARWAKPNNLAIFIFLGRGLYFNSG